MSFEIVRDLPPLNDGAVEHAVMAFTLETQPDGDKQGFYDQTIQTIASYTFLRQPGDFWLDHENGEVRAYALGHVIRDVDNRMTYWLTQAWIAPRSRSLTYAKECWNKMFQQAKRYMCDHIIVVSSRENNLAYCRFLGKDFSQYAVLLKADI